MQLFLDEVGARHPDEKIVMVLDGAGWHRSGSLKPPRNMKLLPLPPYAPELNPVEHGWDELREKYFHNKVFDSLDALENQLEAALGHLKIILHGLSPLSHGIGLLLHYRIRNGITPYQRLAMVA